MVKTSLPSKMIQRRYRSTSKLYKI